MVIPLQSPDV